MVVGRILGYLTLIKLILKVTVKRHWFKPVCVRVIRKSSYRRSSQSLYAQAQLAIVAKVKGRSTTSLRETRSPLQSAKHHVFESKTKNTVLNDGASPDFRCDHSRELCCFLCSSLQNVSYAFVIFSLYPLKQENPPKAGLFGSV
ncbi:hypothetical protein LEP1GSC024_0314 [Leptospira noguchii str. 2001034031]|uniref:Uncharacterized protein n=1 Tax=Leptospira noguchii str. 2001034031 TaxID=1193053 RepID=M6YNN3_9LEPT|nr:hypothetical protein LEP1GSC024_0314 [Leptospira noguchii str. 2001034031]